MTLRFAANLLAAVLAHARRTARWSVFALALLLPAAAQAQIRQPVMLEQWSGWEDLGGAFFKRPECVSSQTNRLDCFSVQFGGVVGTRQWAQNTWSTLININGVVPEHFFNSGANCVSWGPDHVDCFVRRDGDDQMFRRTFQTGSDSGWEALGGVLTSDPSCVSTALRHLDCFARGTDGQLHRNSFDGDIWSGWSALGGQVMADSKPSCVVFRGGIDCMAVFTDSRLEIYQVQSGGAATIIHPSVPNTVQAIAAGTDASFRCVVAPGANAQSSRIECFAPELTTAPTLGRWEFDGSNVTVSDTGPITGFLNSYDWDCVAQQGERVDCVDITGHATPGFGPTITSMTMRHLNLNFQPSTNWRTQALTVPSGAGFPVFVRCTSWGPQRLDCFASGGGLSATHLLHAWLSPQPVRLGLPGTPH